MKSASVVPVWMLVVGAMVSCGGYPPPVDQLAASQAAIRAAQVKGAESSPQAALHLKLAREQVDGAKALMADGDNEKAEWGLKRAEADAELALTLAQEAAISSEAKRARKKLDKIDDE